MLGTIRPDPRKWKWFSGDFMKVVTTKSSLKTAQISVSILACYEVSPAWKSEQFSNPKLQTWKFPRKALVLLASESCKNLNCYYRVFTPTVSTISRNKAPFCFHSNAQYLSIRCTVKWILNLKYSVSFLSREWSQGELWYPEDVV